MLERYQQYWANSELAEAIALAHDLGHPPFGHTGEEQLQSLLLDDGGFDHNLQALKIVTKLEEMYASSWVKFNNRDIRRDN